MEQTFSDDADVTRDDVSVTLGIVSDIDDVTAATTQVEERQNVAEDVGARSDFLPLKLNSEN